MITRPSVGRSSGSVRLNRRSGGFRSRSEIAAAMADVVGVEPSPAHPRAPFRRPVPGLAPLAALRGVVEQYVGRLQAQGFTVAGATAEIERAVRHALPGDTPDWSTHLLLQELERWTIAAYAVRDGGASGRSLGPAGRPRTDGAGGAGGGAGGDGGRAA